MLRRLRSAVAPKGGQEHPSILDSSSPALKGLLKEYMEFPSYHDESWDTVLTCIPSLLPPFLYRRRWIEYILFCGPTLKNSLIEELSMHIVIEALLVTVTFQPIMGVLTDPDGLEGSIMYLCLYISCIIQLICISVHILAVISIVAIDEAVILEWAADKIDAFTEAGVLHTISYFSFIFCVGLWPLLTISANNAYYLKYACFGSFFFLIILSTIPWGPVGIVNNLFFPQLLILHFPNKSDLRKTVEKNVLLLSKDLKLKLLPEEDIPEHSRSQRITFISESAILGRDCTTSKSWSTMCDFLESIGLQKYSDVFLKQDITALDILAELDNNDFTKLGLTIGERVKMKNKLSQHMSFTKPI